MCANATSRQTCVVTTTNPPFDLANLGPREQLAAGRLPERLVRLVVGLWLYGLSIALMIKGAVGASPRFRPAQVRDPQILARSASPD